MLDLEGPRLKLKRAYEHFEFLSKEIMAFLTAEPHPYSVTVQFDAKTKRIVFYGWIHRQPDPMWSIRVGEFAHNMRSALDLTLYQAAPNRVRHHENLTWPIHVNPRKFESDGAPLIVWLPDEPRAVIERAQPYKRTDIPPQFDLLAILADLNNTDKHRLIPVVGSVAGVSLKLWTDGELRNLSFVQYGSGGITKNGAPIGHIRADADKGVVVKMQPHYTFAVLFGKGTRAAKLPVVELCRDIHARVTKLVDEFDAHIK